MLGGRGETIHCTATFNQFQNTFIAMEFSSGEKNDRLLCNDTKFIVKHC